MNTFSTVIAWVAYNATAGSNVFHIERLAKVVTPTIIFTAAIILFAAAIYAKLLAGEYADCKRLQNARCKRRKKAFIKSPLAVKVHSPVLIHRPTTPNASFALGVCLFHVLASRSARTCLGHFADNEFTYV